jgi:hypothetical protein
MEQTPEIAASNVAGAAIQLHDLCVRKEQQTRLVQSTVQLRSISHHADVSVRNGTPYPSVDDVPNGGMPHGTHGAAYDAQVLHETPSGVSMFHVPLHRISKLFAPHGTSAVAHSILGMASGDEIMQPMLFAQPTVELLAQKDGQPGIPYRRWGGPLVPVCNIKQLAEFQLADTERAITQRSATTNTATTSRK